MTAYVLLIIDMQNDFVLPPPEGKARGRGALETVPRIAGALEYFRRNRCPVYHIIRQHSPDGSDVERFRRESFLANGGYTLPGSHGSEIVEPLKPRPGETVIIKKRFSGFMNTPLDLMLRNLDNPHLVICGTQYPNCIRMTVFDAVSLGYPVTLLTDATSAHTREIAENNIRDIREIGVSCITLEEYIEIAG